jgi:hypothetical protein
MILDMYNLSTLSLDRLDKLRLEQEQEINYLTTLLIETEEVLCQIDEEIHRRETLTWETRR